MIEQSINRLEYLVNIVPPLLTKIPEDEFSFKPSPAKWSKKQIIGHLIDSATNNHQRFVRGQYEDDPEIIYNQDKWNDFSYHQQIDKEQIILFWTIYNKQLVEIIKRIPEESLKRQARIIEGLKTLEFLINDYVKHMEHHLRQVIEYT